jgi:hypothetical protein
MADLVDRQRLGLAQPPLRVEGLFLEEAADRVGRAHEVGVDLALLLVGREDGMIWAARSRSACIACADLNPGRTR